MISGLMLRIINSVFLCCSQGSDFLEVAKSHTGCPRLPTTQSCQQSITTAISTFQAMELSLATSCKKNCFILLLLYTLLWSWKFEKGIDRWPAQQNLTRLLHQFDGIWFLRASDLFTSVSASYDFTSNSRAQHRPFSLIRSQRYRPLPCRRHCCRYCDP